jgi:hypothetical protein
MENPFLITFDGVPHNAEIEALINEKFEKIHAQNPPVIKCHVRLEQQSKHHNKGNKVSVCLDFKFAGFEDIVVTENCEEDPLSLKYAVLAVFKEAIELARERRKYSVEQKRIPIKERAKLEATTPKPRHAVRAA